MRQLHDVDDASESRPRPKFIVGWWPRLRDGDLLIRTRLARLYRQTGFHANVVLEVDWNTQRFVTA